MALRTESSKAGQYSFSGLNELSCIILFGGLFYLAYSYAMSFGNVIASIFWFPDAILLCALLLVRPRKWWVYLLVPLPIRLLLVSSSMPAWFLWAAYANDSLKALLAGLLLRYFLKDPTRLESSRDFLLFICVAVLLAPLISAFEGAGARYLLGYEFWASWEQWFMGDALATLILVPTILSWIKGGWKVPWNAARPPRVELLLVWAALLGTAWLAFNGSSGARQSSWLVYSPVPFLLWISTRFGLREASLALTTIAFFTSISAMRGVGPFADDQDVENVVHMQLFLFLIGLPSLLLAVIGGERRRAEDSLKELNDRNTAMLKAMPDLMFLLTKEGVYLDYHNPNRDHFFMAPEEFLNRNIREVLPPPLAEKCLQSFKAVSTTGEARIIEYSLPLQGEERCFEARIVRSGLENVLALVRDITEQKKAEQELCHTEERYREIVESQTDLVCRYLADTTLTFVNEACCRLFGRRRDELIGRKFLELIPRTSRALIMKDIHSLRQGSPLIVREYEVIQANGTTAWQHWVIHPITGEKRNVLECQAIGRDISDRKRAEEAQQNLAHASRLAVVGELTAMVAHEVTQPLGAILTNADAAEMLLAREEPPLEELREILLAIRKDNLRATETIQRIRKLLRKRPAEMHPLNVNEFTSEVLELVAGDALRRHVHLHSELEPGLPLVRGDKVHLQQVLLNLIVNGMDAMANTSVDERNLTVKTSRREGGSIEVSVMDTGHGISPEKLPRLFESFFTTKPHGMGIGLSIARSIIEAHEGHLWAENNPAGGAIFRFDLPATSDSRKPESFQSPDRIVHPCGIG